MCLFSRRREFLLDLDRALGAKQTRIPSRLCFSTGISEKFVPSLSWQITSFFRLMNSQNRKNDINMESQIFWVWKFWKTAILELDRQGPRPIWGNTHANHGALRIRYINMELQNNRMTKSHHHELLCLLKNALYYQKFRVPRRTHSSLALNTCLQSRA